MLNLILSLFLAASSFAGDWEVNTGGASSNFYMIIHDRDDVRVFDANWYPSRVRRSKWEGNTLIVDFYPGDKLQMFSLEADLSAETVKGTFRIPTANFTVEREATLRQRSGFPYTEPWKILEDRERNQKIDLVEFLSQRAPLESFESFSAFWEKDFNSRFYYFLYPLLDNLDKSGNDEKERALRDFYQLLVKNRESIGEITASLKGKDGFTTVLVPDLGQADTLDVPVTSYQIPIPPGVKICCGLKTHDIENFQLVKVAWDQATSASDGEE